MPRDGHSRNDGASDTPQLNTEELRIQRKSQRSGFHVHVARDRVSLVEPPSCIKQVNERTNAGNGGQRACQLDALAHACDQSDATKGDE